MNNLAKHFLVTLVLWPAILSAGDIGIANSISHGFRDGAARTVTVYPPTKAIELIASESTLDRAFLESLDHKFTLDGIRFVSAFQGNRQIYRYKRSDVPEDITPLGFSMSKSLVALTVGHALCAGKIQSLNDRASKYLSALGETSWGRSTVADLLKMSSGSFVTDVMTMAGHKNKSLWNELGEGVFRGELIQNYQDIMRREDEMTSTPGKVFNYNNMDTLALSLVVEGATGLPFARYFSETTWNDIRAKDRGVWVRNDAGQVSAYQGFSATPDDWIRVGIWLLETLGKTETCMGRFLNDATSHQISVLMDAPSNSYGYQTWIGCTPKADFCFLGNFGQHLLFNKKNKVVMYIHSASTQNSVYRSKRHFGEIISRLEAQVPDSPDDRLSVEWACDPGVIKTNRAGLLDNAAKESAFKPWVGKSHVIRRDGDTWEWSTRNQNGALTRWKIQWDKTGLTLTGSLIHEIRGWEARWTPVKATKSHDVSDSPTVYESKNLTRKCRVTIVRY